jgi:7-keto-8-aminopelargonate synthetase-like enzyme
MTTTPTGFVERCAAAAADLGLFFVGAAESDMMAALHQVRSNLEAELAESFGADVAALMAQAFVAAVVGRRREIEHATPVGGPRLH